MTKHASLEKFQAVKEKLAKVGISIKRNLDSEEYQVYPKGDEPGEDSTYFTHKLTEADLKDALKTGLDMAERLGLTRKNPKEILTFEEIKDELENYGIGIIKTKYGIGPVDSKDFHQFQVYEIGNKFHGKSYYSVSNTDHDLKLAFEAGLKMAKKLGHKRIPYIEKRQNPKCKIIEVKRKIRILGKPRVVKVKRKICNPELDLARMKRLLVSELSQYDQRLQAKQPNNYRLAIYFGAVEKAFDRLNENSTLEDMKESICRSFDPELPPVRKFLKKYT